MLSSIGQMLTSRVSQMFTVDPDQSQAESLVYEEYADQLPSDFDPGDKGSLLKVVLEEYKLLAPHIPQGMVVAPSMESILEWHGVVFIRDGWFNGGVFKFVMQIPPEYPNSPPSIFFFNKLFHPLVDAETGRLDISPAFPVWKPGRDYLVLALAFVKKIFSKKELNRYAFTLPSDEFKKCCDECVAESQRLLYISHANSPIPFSEGSELEEMEKFVETFRGTKTAYNKSIDALVDMLIKGV